MIQCIRARTMFELFLGQVRDGCPLSTLTQKILDGNLPEKEVCLLIYNKLRTLHEVVETFTWCFMSMGNEEENWSVFPSILLLGLCVELDLQPLSYPTTRMTRRSSCRSDIL